MENKKTFRTKTGYCHILPDKIVLTRDGNLGNIAKVVVGNNIAKVLIIYGLLAMWLLYRTYHLILIGNSASAVFYGIIGLFLIYSILASLNNSGTPIVERKAIKRIEFKKGFAGLTRSRFEVIFENDSGRAKKRLIMLPGSLTDGAKETNIALKIMAEEGLIDSSQQ